MAARLMRTDAAAKEGLNELIEMLPNNLVGVEIGSYAGESSELFAASKKFNCLYCVDFWQKDFYPNGRETGELEFDLVKKKYPQIHKIKIDNRFIVDVLYQLNPDFVYIDADHEYESVKQNIKDALTLLNGKGIIVGHDYIDTPANPFGGVIKAVNELVGTPDKIFKDTSWIKFL